MFFLILCASLPAAEVTVDTVFNNFEQPGNPNSQYYGTRIVSDNALIHVVYYYFDIANPANESIRYSFSNDFGATWSAPLIDLQAQVFAPVIQANGNNVYIAYIQQTANRHIRFIQGTTASLASDQDISVSFLGASAMQTFMVALDLFRDANGHLHLTWAAGPTQATQQVYYSKSTDNGTSWSAPVQLSAAVSNAPSPRFVTNAARTQMALIWSTGTSIEYVNFNAGGNASLSAHQIYSDGGLGVDQQSGVIDNAGNLHLAYLRSGNTIVYDQVGQAPIVLDAGSVAAPVMSYSQLSLVPVVSWYKGTLGKTAGSSDIWQSSQISNTAFSTPVLVNDNVNLGRHPFLNSSSLDDRMHYFYWTTPASGLAVYKYLQDFIAPLQPAVLNVSYSYPSGICNTGNIDMVLSVPAMPAGATDLQFNINGLIFSPFQPGLSYTFTNIARNQNLTVGVVARDAALNLSLPITALTTVPTVNAALCSSFNGFGEELYSIPNPFSPGSNLFPAVPGDPSGTTRLVLNLPVAQVGAVVDFYIYNTHGILVYRAQASANTAFPNVLWDGRGMSREILPNGVYVLRAVLSSNPGKTYRGRLTLLDANP